MSRFVEEQNRRLDFLLPASLDDYVCEDNPVRVIDAFMGELDLPTPGFAGATPAHISMRRGFLYLVSIMDWATRKILAWRLSNPMDAGFCVAALLRWRKRWPGSAGPRFSTPTKAASLPASPSPACCAMSRSASA